MQQEAIINAMRAMGWDPESDIPMANEENMRIVKELDELVEEKARLDETQQQIEERLEKLHQHAKNAEVSLNQNLTLLQAHQTEVATESHLYKLADREHSKMKQDIKKITKEMENYKEFRDNTEKELCKRKKAVDDLTNRVKWAKTALIEWNEAMEDGNKGYQLIEKYFKEDQLLANEKNQRLVMVEKEIAKCRKELTILYDEQKSLEQNLECTANLYRSAHAERRQMVETWKSAVQVMLQRENDIESGEAELIVLKAEAKKKSAELKKYDDRLNEVINNNSEVEAAIEELNSYSSEIKEQISRIVEMGILKQGETDQLQKELQDLCNAVVQQRAEIRKNQLQKNDKLEHLESFGDVIRKLEQRTAQMENKNLSSANRLQILEEMNDTEDKAQNVIAKEITHLNGILYRAQQQVAKMMDEMKVLQVNNSGLVVTIAAVKKNIQKTEKELARQTELNYNLGFKCLKFERRIIKMQGGAVDPEVEQRDRDYLQSLESQHALIIKRLSATESQNKKLDDTMRKLTDVYNKDRDKLEVVYFKIKEAQTYCEGGAKRLKAELQANQIGIVELSIWKMRATEFETEIATCENSSYNLAKHRMNLIRTMNDRMVEIKSQLDLLNLKRKHLTEERSTLRADISERNKHLEAVRARLELTSKLLGANEDGSLVTATQLKVETAQEKQMLLDEGNELNRKVLKAEEEIKAMENTLLLLSNANDAYRNTMRKKEDEDEVTVELKNLQENYCQALSRLKTLRNRILRLEQETERASKQKEELENKLEMVTRKRLENNENLTKLQKELLDQKVKLQRAEREIKSALKAIKQKAFSAEFIALYERELDLRELEYRNSNAINHLADMADNDDDVGPKIICLMTDKGIRMPHTLQKTRSFASWRSEVSDISGSSCKDLAVSSTSRSSASEASQLAVQASVVSIDFPGPK